MSKKVIVFTMQGCPWCQQLKEQLNEKGIVYETKDVVEFSTMYKNFVDITKSELLPAVLVGKNALVPEKSFVTIDGAVKAISQLVND